MAGLKWDKGVTRGDAEYILKPIGYATTPSLSLLSHADSIVNEYRGYHVDALDHRRDMNSIDLDRQTSLHAKQASNQALNRLSDEGFAWRDIARVLRVTVPAITKWRKGAGVSGQNRLAIARLSALLDMLADRSISEPASWLEMPLLDGVALTGLDLLVAGRYDLVLELAGAHPGDRTAESVLDEFDSGWRATFVDTKFESFIADDGAVSIRLQAQADE
ncbi:MAG: transcriptional regulator [Mycobacterium sp.]|uniref:transcriptional regulator n=1 Tax=Mycobacterium sp. TaxID=1785 RepID=UPI003C688869